MSGGFRKGFLYGSYATQQDSILGFEMGFMKIDNLAGGQADTFTIAIMIANFSLAIGIILSEE